jgi:3-methyladenine DNA glycosylase Mpg
MLHIFSNICILTIFSIILLQMRRFFTNREVRIRRNRRSDSVSDSRRVVVDSDRDLGDWFSYPGNQIVSFAYQRPD